MKWNAETMIVEATDEELLNMSEEELNNILEKALQLGYRLCEEIRYAKASFDSQRRLKEMQEETKQIAERNKIAKYFLLMEDIEKYFSLPKNPTKEQQQIHHHKMLWLIKGWELGVIVVEPSVEPILRKYKSKHKGEAG